MTSANTMHVTPELGIPMSEPEKFVDLFARVQAACETAKDLEAFGLDLSTSAEDHYNAGVLVNAYAENPEAASKAATTKRVATLRPASIVLASNILQEFCHVVVEDSLHIRNLVTNKLLLESEHANPTVRLKAIELLGKISDVGLFAEKREVTITHSTSDELRAKLKNKLHKLVGSSEEDNISEAEYSVVEPENE